MITRITNIISSVDYVCVIIYVIMFLHTGTLCRILTMVPLVRNWSNRAPVQDTHRVFLGCRSEAIRLQNVQDQIDILQYKYKYIAGFVAAWQPGTKHMASMIPRNP